MDLKGKSEPKAVKVESKEGNTDEKLNCTDLKIDHQGRRV
jgi:hypothetical protein